MSLALDANPDICIMLNPSTERVYILTESVLRFVIEHGRLPFTHEQFQDRSTHLGHDVASIAEDPFGQDGPVAPATQDVAANRKTLGSRTRKAACEACYEARKRCEGQRPCSRCTLLQLTCVPRKPRPRKARAIRFTKDPAVHAPQVGNHGEHSGATYLPGEQVNVDPEFLPDGCFSVWRLGPNRDDGVDITPQVPFMQQSTSASSSSNEHPEYVAHVTFEYAPGAYDGLA